MDRILTVMTPASSKDLTTIAAVKAQLGISGSASDAQLTALVTSASVAAANKCNSELVLEPVSEQFRPYPFIDSASLSNLPEFIYLRRLPVVTVTSIIEDDVTLVVDTDYEIDKTRGKITRLYNDLPTRWHFRKLVVAYSGGYTLGVDEPADLEQAVIEIVKDMWFASSRDPLIRTESIPGVRDVQYWVGTVGSDGGWPPRVTDLLGAYQRPLF